MRMNRAPLGLLVAALLTFALATTVAAPPPAAAADGTYPRGVAADTARVVPMDLARATQLASKAVQDFARELWRTAEGTYQSGCVSSGGLCEVGTGFNVTVHSGRCYLDFATGASAWVSAYRVIDVPATEAATDWDQNPVAAASETYYIKVKWGHATADGLEGADPSYLADTDASTAGYLTLCSVAIDSTDASAAQYTITDSRTVLPGPSYNPNPYAFGDDLDVGGDLQVDGDANVTGDQTWGPDGGPATATLTVATGALDLDGACTAGGLLTGSVGVDVPTVGITLADDVPVYLDTAAAVTLVYDATGTEVDLHGADVDMDNDLAVAGLCTCSAGLGVTTVGLDLEDNVGIRFDTAGAYSITYDSTGTELDVVATTVDFSGDVDVPSGTVDAGDLAVDGATIASTPAEIDAIADLSAAGMLPRTCWVEVDTAGERTAGAHTICTLPAFAIVTDVYMWVETQEATGTKTVDVGPAGTADGYANDLSVAAGGVFRPGVALDGGGAYFATSTRGSLLATLVAGASTDDRGLYYEAPDTTSGGAAVSYTVPGGGWTEFVGGFLVQYLAGAP